MKLSSARDGDETSGPSLPSLRFCKLKLLSGLAVNTQTATIFETRRYRQSDDKIRDAFAGYRLRGVLESLASLSRPVIDHIPVIEPGRPQNCVVEIRRLDNACRFAIRIENAAVVLARNLVIDSHRADKDQPFHAGLVHRLHDGSRLLF